MTPEYLAGFFDGEGTFYLGLQKAKNPNNPKMYPKAQVMLSQSGDEGLALLQQIQKEYGGSIYVHLKPGEYKATKAAYKLWWNKQEAIGLIKRIYEHLILKQEAAHAVLTYLERNNEQK